ncbi:MAG: J domain-containing protein [Desulfocapsaceae bacterium]|nr:J domain-containing protein [Desulfocapsaceae bacterium]
MTKDEWQAIDEARQLLNLAERATMGEIKRAYRKMCKLYHPDLVGEESPADAAIIRKLTRGYDLLMHYCDQFRIPLVPDDGDNIEPEDWWMDRFGNDPLWGSKKGKTKTASKK